MKIIGLLTAWASEDWIEYSIQQALDLVDELIISIGAHNKYFKMIEDKTDEKAKKYLTNKKIKVVQAVSGPSNDPDKNKCATLNRMLHVSENIEIGNLIWILDVDEFYSKNAIDEINLFIKTNNDFDEIQFFSYYFCINLEYYITSHLNRIFKIKQNDIYFTPTQILNPKCVKTVTLLENNPMFHYSLLTGEQLRAIYWLSTDKFERLIWYMKIYKKYDPLKGEYWIKKNQELNGIYGFWFHDIDIIENNGHGLFRYYGKHPELIENSPLKQISDFRTYMRKKPNYKKYLLAMKELIVGKKKKSFKKALRDNIYLSLFTLKKLFFIGRIFDIINNLLIILLKLSKIDYGLLKFDENGYAIDSRNKFQHLIAILLKCVEILKSRKMLLKTDDDWTKPPPLDLKEKAIIDAIKNSSSKCIILDVGCGSGGIDFHMAKLGYSIYAIDLKRYKTWKNINKNEGFLKFFQANIYALKTFPIINCPIVICSEVLEHLVNYKLALKNLLEIVQYRLIITIPFEKSFGGRFAPPPQGHCNFWSDKKKIFRYKDINEFYKLCYPNKVSIAKIRTKEQDEGTRNFCYLIIIDKNKI